MMKPLTFAALTAAFGICGCSSTADIPAVKTIDLPSYMGTWYEIARLPNYFEKNMSDVSAEYAMLPDGRIQVVNRGMRNGIPTSITGTARRKNNTADGNLEVSFFRPIYSDYRIIKLAPDYRYSVVTGSNRGYLWILARKPRLPQEDMTEIIDFLRHHRFDVNGLIYSN